MAKKMSAEERKMKRAIARFNKPVELIQLQIVFNNHVAAMAAMVDTLERLTVLLGAAQKHGVHVDKPTPRRAAARK